MLISSLNGHHFVKPGEEYLVVTQTFGAELQLMLEPKIPERSKASEFFSWWTERPPFPKHPVRVEDGKIVTNIHQMEVDFPYLAALLDKLFILRKTKDGIIETYELREAP